MSRLYWRQMRNQLIAVLVVLACGVWAPITAQPCQPKSLQVATEQVKAQQSDLLAYKLTDEMDEEVPITLQAKIRAFKDSLAALADATLACQPSNTEPNKLESTFAAQLDANKPVVQEVYDPKQPPQLDHIYGDGIQVKVSAPTNPPDLLLIEFGFGIDCGYDSVLLAYEQHNGRWQRLLRWQSGDYKDVSDAFGDFFDYVVIPKTGSKNWLLAVAHGNPWCTSRWSGFDLDLIQPAMGAQPQKVLQHLSKGYVRFGIEPKLKLVPEGFQLRVETGMLDVDIMTRVGIYRYRVRDNQLERVQPIANNGRDFVDEWLQVPWSDAERWIAPSQKHELEQLYHRIQSEQSGNAENWPLIEYGAVRGCSDSPAHFQVEMTEDRSMNKPPRPSNTIYFQIDESKNSFTMVSASETKGSRCRGADIMPQN